LRRLHDEGCQVGKNEPVTMALDPEIIKRVRILALERGEKANELVNAALAEYLQKHQPKPQKPPK